jgi:hypothetical protein
MAAPPPIEGMFTVYVNEQTHAIDIRIVRPDFIYLMRFPALDDVSPAAVVYALVSACNRALTPFVIQ